MHTCTNTLTHAHNSAFSTVQGSYLLNHSLLRRSAPFTLKDDSMISQGLHRCDLPQNFVISTTKELFENYLKMHVLTPYKLLIS